MAYVPESTPTDGEIAVVVRIVVGPARLVPLPFYKRPRS